jgi:N-acetylmuramoyl-L-alanine amidase
VLRADALASALGGTLSPQPGGHALLRVSGVAVDVADRVPFVTIAGDVVPLACAPFVAEGQWYVPLQLAVAVLPRYDSTLAYDAARGELRIAGAAREAVRGADSTAPQAVSSASAAPVGSPANHASDAPHRRRVIVVDAGHGGPDNGMTGPIGGTFEIREKDITLAVAKRLAATLRERGLVVAMTRTTDTLIALADRGRIAYARKADLFISVHVNAANLAWSDPEGARGFETYFLAEAKTEDAKRVEQMENEAVRFETGANAPKGDPLAFIINDMAQNEHLRESSDLAATIQERLATVHPGPSRGVKQANFAVLRTSFMPAVLVEIGFGTNRAEAKYLDDPSQQRRLAAAIADATVEYLDRYQRRVQTASP